MNFDNKLPEWKNEGVEPSESLRENGFQSGYKPPASIFNWFFSLVQKIIAEIQSKLGLVPYGLQPVAATSTDGVTYSATVEGITELYNGLTLTIIPNMNSTNAAVQFNLNGLGAKNLRVKIDGYNSGNSGTIAAFAGWIGENTPIKIRYLSKFDAWQTVDFSRASASGIYGTIKVEGGGTGADNAKEGLDNLLSGKNGIELYNGTMNYGTVSVAVEGLADYTLVVVKAGASRVICYVNKTSTGSFTITGTGTGTLSDADSITLASVVLSGTYAGSNATITKNESSLKILWQTANNPTEAQVFSIVGII